MLQDAERLYNEVVAAQTAALGAQHLDTLRYTHAGIAHASLMHRIYMSHLGAEHCSGAEIDVHRTQGQQKGTGRQQG